MTWRKYATTWPVQLIYLVQLLAFAAGALLMQWDRLRLALSTTYWPVVWPSAEAATLTLFPGDSTLSLPLRPSRPEDADLPPFEEPVGAPPPEHTDIHPGGVERWEERDDEGRVVETLVLDLEPDGRPSLTRMDDIALTTGHGVRERFSIHPDDPLSALAQVLQRGYVERDGWSARIEVESELSATADVFRLEARLCAWEGEERVFERRWVRRIPRSR